MIIIVFCRCVFTRIDSINTESNIIDKIVYITCSVIPAIEFRYMPI